MFDTMTMTKAVGAVCASFLVFLLAGWAGTSLYTVGGHGEGGHEEAAAQAYTIEVAAAEPAAAAEAAPDFQVLLASADATAGEAVFKKCGSCHKVNGENAVGPHLNGVVGRNHAAVEGYSYSEANLALKAEVWTPENINGFIENPKKYMPGTKMAFAGLAKPEDRANVIAYLETLK